MHHILWWHRQQAAWWRDVHPLLVGRNVRAVFGGDFGPMKFSHMQRDGIDYLQCSIEGIPDLKFLRNILYSRLLSQQFDNYLHVTVNGPQVTVAVKTVGEISLGKFTPQQWDAVDDYRPPKTSNATPVGRGRHRESPAPHGSRLADTGLLCERVHRRAHIEALQTGLIHRSLSGSTPGGLVGSTNMRIASLLLLMVLPGSWLAFCPGSAHLSYGARFALAIVLSPPVAAVQFFVLRLAGLTFQQVVPVLQFVNLGSLFLIVRAFSSRYPRISWRQGLLGGTVYASVAACVAIPWLWQPDFRQYSWHGLLHTDIVYTFARGALLPEEPELAGIALGYPWVGHVFWALLAWSADLSPTIIYVVTNLALLGATGMLYYTLARDLGASEVTSLATPVILALGTNLPGLIGWSIIPPNDNGIWWGILGDLRYAPFLLKFVTFETMPFGLALHSALVYLSVSAVRKHKSLEIFLIPTILTASAALYPNLFPASALLVMALIVTLFFGRQYTEGQYQQNNCLVWCS